MQVDLSCWSVWIQGVADRGGLHYAHSLLRLLRHRASAAGDSVVEEEGLTC